MFTQSATYDHATNLEYYTAYTGYICINVLTFFKIIITHANQKPWMTSEGHPRNCLQVRQQGLAQQGLICLGPSDNWSVTMHKRYTVYVARLSGHHWPIKLHHLIVLAMTHCQYIVSWSGQTAQGLICYLLFILKNMWLWVRYTKQVKQLSI